MESNRGHRLLLIAALVATAGAAFIASSKSSNPTGQQPQTWDVQLGQNAQANSTLAIRNQCQQPHSFTVTAQNIPYLRLPTPAIVNVPGGSVYDMTVRFDTSGLNPGEYRGNVVVKCDNCNREKTCKQDFETLQLRLTVQANEPSPSPTPMSVSTATPPPTPTPSPAGHGSMPTPTPSPTTSPSPCAPTPAPAKYSVKDLKVLPTIDGSTPHCLATGVDDAGNVVGACNGKYKGGPIDGGWRAFRTDSGGAVITDKDELKFPVDVAGGTSFATGVNAAGHVV